MKIENIESLFHEELKDIYDAEKRLTKAIPKMIKAAHSPELKEALEGHLEVTQTQIGRLDEVFEAIGVKPAAKTCLAMKGLLEEGEEALAIEGPDAIQDLALIGAARRVEHYEMAAYLSLQDLAEHLDLPEVEELLAANLDEENEADDTLAEISAGLLESLGEEPEPAVAASSRKKKATA